MTSFPLVLAALAEVTVIAWILSRGRSNQPATREVRTRD
jgi:hypothetical protein